MKPDPKPEPRQKKKKTFLKRVPLKKVYKATGEKLVFAQIWRVRKHICENCKDFLGHEAKAHFFAHDIPKSRGEQYRLDANNILLLCQPCHHAKDFQGIEKFNARKK